MGSRHGDSRAPTGSAGQRRAPCGRPLPPGRSGLPGSVPGHHPLPAQGIPAPSGRGWRVGGCGGAGGGPAHPGGVPEPPRPAPAPRSSIAAATDSAAAEPPEPRAAPGGQRRDVTGRPPRSAEPQPQGGSGPPAAREAVGGGGRRRAPLCHRHRRHRRPGHGGGAAVRRGAAGGGRGGGRAALPRAPPPRPRCAAGGRTGQAAPQAGADRAQQERWVSGDGEGGYPGESLGWWGGSGSAWSRQPCDAAHPVAGTPGLLVLLVTTGGGLTLHRWDAAHPAPWDAPRSSVAEHPLGDAVRSVPPRGCALRCSPRTEHPRGLGASHTQRTQHIPG